MNCKNIVLKNFELTSAQEQILQKNQKTVSSLEAMVKEKNSDFFPHFAPIRAPNAFHSPHYLNDLQAYFDHHLDESINIVIFGEQGSGVSSFANTLGTALLKKEVTLRFSNSPISGVQVGNLTIARISPTVTEAEEILTEVVRQEEKQRSKHTMELEKESFDSKAEPPLDAYVVLVDASKIADERYVKRIGAMVKQPRFGMRIHPVIALNKIDLIDPLLLESMGKAFESVQVRKAMLAVKEATGLPLRRIIPVKSYDSEWERSEDVEKLALLCLKEAMEVNGWK
jgi:signal recognition particle receptor subunit beta